MFPVQFVERCGVIAPQAVCYSARVPKRAAHRPEQLLGRGHAHEADGHHVPEHVSNHQHYYCEPSFLIILTVAYHFVHILGFHKSRGHHGFVVVVVVLAYERPPLLDIGLLKCLPNTTTFFMSVHLVSADTAGVLPTLRFPVCGCHSSTPMSIGTTKLCD